MPRTLEPTIPPPGPRKDLSPILWLWLPLATIPARMALAFLSDESWEALLANETGIIENLTVFLLLPAVVLGVAIFLRRRELPRGIGIVMLLMALAALYFAGEECSWGQVYFGWETPESFAEINDQNETNIHRTSNIFNNVPRTLMTIGTVVGGIILPLVLIGAKFTPSEPLYWIVPNYRLVVVSILAVVPRLMEKIPKALDLQPADESWLGKAFFRDSGEYKELYFAMVIVLFVVSVYRRMGPRRAESPRE